MTAVVNARLVLLLLSGLPVAVHARGRRVARARLGVDSSRIHDLFSAMPRQKRTVVARPGDGVSIGRFGWGWAPAAVGPLDQRAWPVIPVIPVIAVIAVTAVLSALMWAAGGAGLVLLALAVSAGASGVVMVHRRGRQAHQVEADLPAVLESLAGSVRSGASLPLAVREAAATAGGPIALDLAGVVASVDAGTPLVSALHAWADHRGSGRVRLAVAALTLALECGGGEARTLDGVAATLRDRLAIEREVVALSSQARSSAVVMIAAPAGFVLLTGVGDPAVGEFFLHSSLGFACLAVGIALDAAGGAWMWWIARARS